MRLKEVPYGQIVQMGGLWWVPIAPSVVGCEYPAVVLGVVPERLLTTPEPTRYYGEEKAAFYTRNIGFVQEVKEYLHCEVGHCPYPLAE